MVPRTIAVFVLAISGYSSSLKAAEVERFRGTLYKSASDIGGQKIGTMEAVLTSESDGSLTQRSEHRDGAGEIGAIETIRFRSRENGDELMSYELDQKQTNEVGKLVIIGGKALFLYGKLGEANKEEVFDRPESPLVGPLLPRLVRQRWSEAEKELKVHLGIVDRKEFIEFRVESNDEKISIPAKLKPKEMWHFLSPDSVFSLKAVKFTIRQFAPRVRLHLDQKEKRLAAYEGRMVLKEKSGSSWKDLLAAVVYEYPDAPAPAKK